MLHLTSGQTKILKWVGYPLLAVLTFAFTLAYTFPYDRLKDKIIEGLSQKYDVSIISIKPSFVPGTFVINTMVLHTRPKTPDEKVVTVLINEIEVDVGVMSAVLWSMDMAKIGVDIEAKIAGGSLALEIEHDKGNNTVMLAAHTNMLPIGSMPGVREAVGLPMTGGLSADMSITLPKGKWAKADGSIKLSCVGCTVGDGKAKMKMKPPPGRANSHRARRRSIFAGDGLTVPRIDLGAMLVEIAIKKGKGEIKTFAAKSKDGFLTMTGDILFKDPFKETLFPGCMSFGFSDDLKERKPKFMAIEAGLPPKAKQEDGSYSIPTKGKLAQLRFDVRRQCAQSGGGGKKDSDARSRPRITTNDKEKPSLTKVIPEAVKTVSKDIDAGEKKSDDDDSTESGPTLGKGIRDLKGRNAIGAKALINRDRDDVGEDMGESTEDEEEDDVGEEDDEEGSDDEDTEDDGDHHDDSGNDDDVGDY